MPVLLRGPGRVGVYGRGTPLARLASPQSFDESREGESVCLERAPSWSIEFQRESLNHAIADPATGPDQKGATPRQQARLASPRLTSTTPTLHHHYGLHPPTLHHSPHGWSNSPGPATSAITCGTTLIADTWLVRGSPPGRHPFIKLPKLALGLFDSSSPGSRPPCSPGALGCRSRLPRVPIGSQTLVSSHGLASPASALLSCCNVKLDDARDIPLPGREARTSHTVVPARACSSHACWGAGAKTRRKSSMLDFLWQHD